jgi:hypothetical protein
MLFAWPQLQTFAVVFLMAYRASPVLETNFSSSIASIVLRLGWGSNSDICFCLAEPEAPKEPAGKVVMRLMIGATGKNTVSW